ncbi:MORN repeat-containing protein 4 isoform X2 [Hydra vulgaris]|uniref:MORN repeat-containing protein 4 isoform X2 n=1 Tax=Hydra vulgaris TaxID=6087 RepID=A0ABM4D2S3_HYDVU
MEIKFERYVYSEGQVYEGEWSADGKKHGLGYLLFPNGDSFSGRFNNGLFYGSGILTLEDGTTYEGEFYEGKFHGYGVYTRPDGMKYEGRFTDGTPNGAGKITFPDGTSGNPKQEGYFRGYRLIKQDHVSEDLLKAQMSAEKARGIASSIRKI